MGHGTDEGEFRGQGCKYELHYMWDKDKNVTNFAEVEVKCNNSRRTICHEVFTCKSAAEQWVREFNINDYEGE